MGEQSYRDLLVWQKAIDLVSKIYTITEKFPPKENFSLTSQIRRSAVSIPSNIAEGQGRNAPKDFLRFLNIAVGSLAELDTQIEIALRQNMLTKPEAKSIFDQMLEIRKMLYGLISSIKKNLK